MTPIPNYTKYSATEDGKIYSHGVRSGWLKPLIDKNGYHRYRIIDNNGKKKSMYAHRLIALTFLPNQDNKKFVNHKDHDKSNNALENLEWVTHLENIRHDWAMGTRSKLKGVEVGGAKMDDRLILKIRQMYRDGARQIELGEFFGISQPTISQIVLRKTWRHI